MAMYGCAYPKWGAFKDTNPDASDSAFPKYGSVKTPGKLVKVTDAPSFNEAKVYGDNALAEYVNEFKECAVTVETTEIENEIASAMFGATIATTGSDLSFGAEDNAPYGGFAFYTKMMVGGQTYYQGVYYPKVKASMSGTEYATKGDSITLATGTINLVASVPANGKWKVLSNKLSTESAAKEWVDAKIVVSTT